MAGAVAHSRRSPREVGALVLVLVALGVTYFGGYSAQAIDGFGCDTTAPDKPADTTVCESTTGPPITPVAPGPPITHPQGPLIVIPPPKPTFPSPRPPIIILPPPK